MKRGLVLGCVVSSVLLTYPMKSPAATVIVQPGEEDGKDISLYKRTDVELSSSKSLYVINTGPPGPGFDDFTSLVEFDLSGVGEGAVASATLWLFESNIPTFSFQHVSSAFPNTIRVEPAESAWEEATVLYSTLPEGASQYAVEETVDAVDTWFGWDVTATVADWLSGTLANHGFLISSTVEVRNGGLVVGAAFASSEQAHSPYLEIDLMSLQPGDYNADGTVDGLDYDRWRADFGSDASASDGNGDGIVDAADYTIWRDHLTVSAAAADGVAVVPEPATAALVATAGCGALALLESRCRRANWLVVAATLAATMIAEGGAQAATVPYTEEFSTDGAGWRDSANNPVSYVASGGVGGVGDGYVSVERTFTANPDFAQTIFRAQDGFDSSGDAFVGDWLAEGVTSFSFWIRHNAPSELTFGTRFATSANSPGANALASPTLVAAPDTWTKLTVPISPSAIAPEGAPSLFDTVFANLGNLQVSVRPGNNLNASLRFDLDRAAIVPEPAALVLAAAGVGMIMGLGRRRGTALACGVLLTTLAVQSHAEPPASIKGSIQELTPLPEPLASFGAATLDGWFYVYGGHVGERHEHSREHVRGTFRRQRLEGGLWEELPGGPALQSPALVAHGSRLYRIGGLSARNSEEEDVDLHSVSSVDCFDPSTRSWSPLVDLPEPRSSHDAVVVGDTIYVAGGWHHHGEEGDGDWLETVVALDLSADADDREWRVVTTAPFRRRALALAAREGQLYVIGGFTEESDFSRRVDVYDLHSGEWSKGPRLPESEMNGFGASAFLIGGRIFASSQSDALLALAENDGGWECVSSTHVPRFFHRLIPGANDSVLLVGGANEEQGHLVSVECVSVR